MERIPRCWFPYSNRILEGEVTINKEEYRYAKQIAVYLWDNYYKENAPLWEPLHNLAGLLTQIDNMITGLDQTKAKEK